MNLPPPHSGSFRDFFVRLARLRSKSSRSNFACCLSIATSGRSPDGSLVAARMPRARMPELNRRTMDVHVQLIVMPCPHTSGFQRFP